MESIIGLAPKAVVVFLSAIAVTASIAAVHRYIKSKIEIIGRLDSLLRAAVLGAFAAAI